ncbi:MAG: 23S rRNA (adenine(2030)-N(6))-methyltransferase RlmJ [Legionellaceae bacterium]|nr:23S rRNA (adenine(2030)-N(6))-methyltransferase RlmJ [Legionellaceae bacterium]
MLSYQHSYHAGNFADVVKHWTLTYILDYLNQKEKPWFYLETHAGRGRYNLRHEASQKNKEYETGILPLWQNRNTLPAVFSKYMTLLEHYNGDSNTLQHYPGSPAIAIEHLRKQDRIYACEQHPHEFSRLSLLATHGKGKRVHFARQDGLESLKALLPPPEKRGLIFMDPSYELKNDYKNIPAIIKDGYQRFPQGVFCIWYPLIDKHPWDIFLRKCNAIQAPDTLSAQFYMSAPHTPGMRGCGVWIINPPYTLKEDMQQFLKSLQTIYKAHEYVIS